MPPRLVLASGTETFPNRMLTAAKKARMTPENLDAYNQALQQVRRGVMEEGAVQRGVTQSSSGRQRGMLGGHPHGPRKLADTSQPLCSPHPPQVGLLAPGGGPFSVLDLFPLTLQCGEECSTDGVHSLPAVYDVALQIMLNVAAAQAP